MNESMNESINQSMNDQGSCVLTLAVHVTLSWEIITALGGPVVPKQHTQHTQHSVHTQMHVDICKY